MNILNLGAGGFIGSHLTQRLLAEGHSVTAIDLWTDKVSEFLDHRASLSFSRTSAAPNGASTPSSRRPTS